MDFIAEDLPLLKLPFKPKTLNFDEGEETFLIPAQIFIHDNFQRRHTLLNGLIKIMINSDKDGSDKKLSQADSETRNDCEPTNGVVKTIKQENNLSSKGIKSSSEFVDYVKNQSKSSKTKFFFEDTSSDASHGNHLLDRGNILNVNTPERNVKDPNVAQRRNDKSFEIKNNSSNMLNHFSECQVENDNILESVKNLYMNENADICPDLRTNEDINSICRELDYVAMLSQVPENASFSNLHTDFDQEVFNIAENSYEDTENTEDMNKNELIIHSVINGELYRSRGKSFDYVYEGNEIDLTGEVLQEPYSILDLDGDQEFDIKRESGKKVEARCELCGRKCRSLNALNHHMLVHSEERPYVCQICQKAFKEQPTLRRHMWTHMAKQHQCDICKKYFVEKSSLRRHMSTIHADFRPGARAPQGSRLQYACPRCNKVFKSLTKYNMHCQLHGNPNYECEVCGKVYAGRSHLKIHQRIHTGEKPFVCNMCDSKFAFKHVLKSHQARIHHRINKYKCNICSLAFLKKSDLSNHASCHMINIRKGKRHYNSQKHSRRCSNVEMKKLLQKNMLKYNISSKNPDYALFGQLIGILPESEQQGGDEEVEVGIGEGDEDILLETLDMKIKSEPSKYYSSLVDPEKKEKKCQKCKKEFERMGDLKRHIISHIVQDITSKAKESSHSIPHYECSICGLSNFKQVDKFKAHLREHAKLTLYKCKFCERAFGDSSNYSKHKKVHGNKYLQCDMCRRKFNTKRMLISHMEYHKGHPPTRCVYCNKEFYFQSSFRKHIKISHQGKANVTYKCEFCGGRFKSVKQKWEHQWEQHGVRKVRADCTVCGERFRKVSLLRAHALREHGACSLASKEEACGLLTQSDTSELLICVGDGQ